MALLSGLFNAVTIALLVAYLLLFNKKITDWPGTISGMVMVLVTVFSLTNAFSLGAVFHVFFILFVLGGLIAAVMEDRAKSYFIISLIMLFDFTFYTGASHYFGDIIPGVFLSRLTFPVIYLLALAFTYMKQGKDGQKSTLTMLFILVILVVYSVSLFQGFNLKAGVQISEEEKEFAEEKALSIWEIIQQRSQAISIRFNCWFKHLGQPDCGCILPSTPYTVR